LNTASLNGKQYGLPWISNPMIIYYNKNILSSNDIARLEKTAEGEFLTLSEFSQMASRYTDLPNGKIGTLFNGWPPFELFLWNFGGEIENQNGELLFQSQAGVKATQYLIDNIVTDPITLNFEKIKSGYAETFQQGNTALLLGGSSDRIELISGKPVPFEIGYAVVPKADAHYTYNWSASTVITNGAKNPDLAFKALSDLTIAIFSWKSVPPVEISDLGFQDYDAYLLATNPQKAGMGKVIEISMGLTKEYSYSAQSAKIYTQVSDKIYIPILNAAVNGNQLDAQTLVDNAMTAITQK
jgi:multiple sugar transport system substrate-binding protein